MIEITDKSKCCGCSACYSVCPVKCIEMKADEEGFLYPEIHRTKCIGCHRCENACPILHKSICLNNLEMAFLVQDNRNDIRLDSSSGGAFTAIAEYIISDGGIVYGVSYSEELEVEHQRAISADGLRKFRGSKYVQSNIKNTYSKIKEDLNEGKKVCFSGTPCQVYGLKSYLGQDSNNLITIDIACHGVQSPWLFKQYVDFWEKRKGSKIVKIDFRSKDFGYAGSTMKLFFSDKKQINNGSKLQFIKDVMFSGLSLRPSCYDCKFKTKERVSDFTLFDCWHADKFCSEMDDDKGTTSVIIHSEKGRWIMGQVSNKWNFCEVDIDQLILSDGDMVMGSAATNSRRKAFYVDLNNISFENMIKKYGNTKSPKRIIITLLKPFLAKIGLLSTIKKIVRNL